MHSCKISYRYRNYTPRCAHAAAGCAAAAALALVAGSVPGRAPHQSRGQQLDTYRWSAWWTRAIDCETPKVKLHESVTVEGDLGRSSLQDLVVSAWQPMKVVVIDGDAKEVVNADDPMVQRIDREYPGLRVADFVIARWQELQLFNPSGNYSVEIPWNVGLERELTPAEVTTIMMRGKGSRKTQGGGGRR